MREVEDIDLKQQVVTTSPGFRPRRLQLKYDHLVIALGNTTNLHGILYAPPSGINSGGHRYGSAVDACPFGDAMARRANLHRSEPNRFSSASGLSLEPRTAEVACEGQTPTKPTVDEVLRDPVVRLMMKCDNVTKDQLIHFIGMAAGHTNG